MGNIETNLYNKDDRASKRMKRVVLSIIISLGSFASILAEQNDSSGVLTTEDIVTRQQDEAFDRLTGAYKHSGEGIVIDETKRSNVMAVIFKPDSITSTNGFSFTVTNPPISQLAVHYAVFSGRTLVINGNIDVEKRIAGEISIDSTNAMGVSQTRIVEILKNNGYLINTFHEESDIMITTNRIAREP